MSTRPGLRVWMARTLCATAPLALALLVCAPASPSGTPARLTAVAVPAVGAPPVVDDTPLQTPAAPSAPVAAPAPACAAPAQGSGRQRLPQGVVTAAATVCPAPERSSVAAPTLRPVTESRLQLPVPPVTGAATRRATAHPTPTVHEPRHAAAPRATATPKAVTLLPIPPPLWLSPAVVPVPESYAAELAPTSVLALGFTAVALASAALALRLFRRGR